MKLFPYRKIIIVSGLSKTEVLARLAKRVGSKQYEKLRRIDANIFTGSRVDDHFELELITDYRNSFTPVIKGTLIETPEGTKLNVMLRSNWPVTIATLVFMTIGLILSVSELTAFIRNEDWTFWYLPGFVLFPYGLWCIAFHMDSRQAIEALLKITQGEIIDTISS